MHGVSPCVRLSRPRKQFLAEKPRFGQFKSRKCRVRLSHIPNHCAHASSLRVGKPMRQAFDQTFWSAAFDCAGSHKMGGTVFSLPKVSFYYSEPCSLFELLCPFRVAGVALSGHFEVWNAVLRCFACDSCRTSDPFSSMWQARQFLHVAKMLAGAG